MGGTNSIPVISQVKSGVQLVCGDVEGAAKTQKDFFQECPIVSQVTSTVQLVTGDPEGALETQKKCGNALLRTADGIPVVGHAKGAIHYVCGDTEGGNKAMLSASRTTGVMAGGAAGFVFGGPVGAVAAGIGAGAAFDTTTTVIDSAVHNEFRPNGYIAGVDNMINNPNPGDIFDLAMMPVGDGIAGYSGGRLVNRFRGSTPAQPGQGPPNIPGQADLAKASILEQQAMNILEAAEDGKMNMPSGEYMRMANEAQGLWKQAQELKGTPVATPDIKLEVKASTPSGGARLVAPNSAPSSSAGGSEAKKTETFLTDLTEVWVVWLSDEVPVIGTSKIVVELAASFLLRDAEAMQVLCQSLAIDPKIFFSEFSSLTIRAAAELAEKYGAIKGISTSSVIDLLKKTGKKGRKAVKTYFSNLFDAAQNLKKKDKRARRGEHVINNGVISVNLEIMDIFLAKSGITRDGIGALALSSDEAHIKNDCERPFHEDRVKTDIRDVLKVYISIEEEYIDANALLYGNSINVLRGFAVQHMKELYEFESTPLRGHNAGRTASLPLRETVRQIVEGLLFVDQNALSVWQREQGPRGKDTYERAQVNVSRMFDGLYDRLGVWVRELKRNGY